MSAEAEGGFTPREAVRLRTFWLVSVGMLFFFTGQGAVTTLAVDFFESREVHNGAAIIAWMAGMLYLPRLFVYHCEAARGSIQSETFKIMERRLLKAIINPAMIALFQGRFALWTKNIHPATSMMLGVLIGAVAMLVMGAVPTLLGACLSGAIFACAEMVFSPRFYAYVQSFAPKGNEGMYGGLTFVPAAIGAWIGGFVSGPLIYVFLPIRGHREPLAIWASYAALGLLCALAMMVYAKLATRPAEK